MRKTHSIIAFFILVFCVKHAAAQDSIPSCAIIGKYNGKQIVLRWGVNNSAAFQLSKQYGYKLERALIGKDTQYVKAVYRTIGIFKPADSNTFKNRVDKKNNFQVIAAYAALGTFKNPLPQNPNLKELHNRQNEQENLFGFAMFAADNDTTAANLLGLRYEDNDITPGAIYAYKLTSLIPESSFKTEPAICFVTAVSNESEIELPELHAFGFEKHIRLSWETRLQAYFYTGYYIEKGDAKGKNFKRLNNVPYTYVRNNEANQNPIIVYTDSVPQDYVTYTYRLIGVTPFAEFSSPGKVVSAYGRDRTAPEAAYDVKAEDVAGKFLKVTWKKDFFEKDFTGFNVLRSPSPLGPFVILNEKILPKTILEYTDLIPDALNGSYYKIECIDTAQNISWSLGVYGYLKDSIPPSMPKGLSGTVDSSGVVTLRWNLGAELDIKGYRVYYANDLKHEFTNITPELYQDTVFRDTVNLNRLTSSIYYQIAAADRNYNHSARTEPLRIVLPDTIPPVKPLFSNILVTDTAVYLSWIPSSSADAVKQILYRSENNGKFVQWKIIDNNTIHNLTDHDIQINGVYSYKIETLDIYGNSSGFPAEVSGKIYDVGKRLAISGFKATYNQDKKRVILNWNYPPSDKYHYVIYRSYNGSSFRVYHSVDGILNAYEDYDLPGKGTYEYAVVAYYMDGGSSGLTKKLIVEVK